MSTRSRAVFKEALQVNTIKRQLEILDGPSDELDTDLLQEPIWKTSRNHLVDFGEANRLCSFVALVSTDYWTTLLL